MRINFVGNTCNYGYWMAKWCREMGLQAYLYISASANYERDMPWWDDTDLKRGQSPEWVKFIKLPFGKEFLPKNKRYNIYREILDCDVIHSFSPDVLGGILDFDIPTIYHSPGDLDRFYHFYGRDKPFKNLFDLREVFRVYRFRQTLKRVNRLILSQFYEIPFGETWVKERLRILPIPYCVEDNNKFNYERTVITTKRFFSPARHYWNFKGNDIIIEAYAESVKKYQDKTPRLILLDWGEDIGKTKQLCFSLGINHMIDWKPCLSKEELYAQMSMPGTIVVDQFVRQFDSAAGVGGIGRDAMMMKAPLITHFSAGNPHMYELHKSKPPILGVERPTKELLFQQMEKSINMSWSDLQEAGQQGKEWLECEHDWRNVMPRYIELYNEVITERGK